MPWYRTIKPEDEIKALTIRERLSSEELKNQRARCPQGYNSATAVKLYT